MNPLQRFALWLSNAVNLAAVTNVPVGRKNDGLVRSPQLGTLDKPWWQLFREFEDSREAWAKNPMARRLVGLITAYVVGPGITLTSTYDPLNRFIAKFWTHEQNNMDLRLAEWCDELTRAGELFPVLWTNAADGMSYVRIVPACQIEDIEYRPDDYESELRYKQPQEPGQEPRYWLSPDEASKQEGSRAEGSRQEGASDDPNYLLSPSAPSALPPWMLHYAVNRPIGAVRGEGDLAPILPWLRRYNGWLEDRVRLNAGMRSFLWIIYAARSKLTELREQYAAPPEPGTLIIAEEGAEKWEAVTPRLNASDAKDDGRAIRWMIAAGGPGTALIDFGEGEESGLSKGADASEQRRRFLTRRQEYFAYVLAHLTVTAYNRWLDTTGHRGRGRRATLQDILVQKPDISPADNERLATTATNLIRSLLDLRGFVGDSEALQRFGLQMYIRYTGESVTESEFAAILAGEKEGQEIAQKETQEKGQNDNIPF
jgi:hypothetical protein